MWKRIVFISGDAACSVRAETTALWQFDDGVPAVAATALVTEVNAPALNGAASQIGTGSNPVHSDDRPGVRIWSRYGGALLNTSNSASLRFVNAGLPAVTNSSSGGVITVPDNDPLLRASNVTVEAFIKVDRHINWPLIVAKPRADSNGSTWNLLLDNTGKLMLRFDTQPLGTGSGAGYNQTWSGTTSLEDGRWHHVAFTYSHTNRAVKAYVDYVLAISMSTFSNLVYDTSPLRIGQGSGAVAFDGKLRLLLCRRCGRGLDFLRDGRAHAAARMAGCGRLGADDAETARPGDRAFWFSAALIHVHAASGHARRHARHASIVNGSRATIR